MSVYSRMLRSTGFTLIELIITVVLLGVTIPLITTAIIEGVRRNTDITVTTQETLLGQSLFEEIRSRRFDEVVTPPWSSLLGPDGGETRSTFDDIDDYHGLSETVPGWSGYTRTASIRYVPPGNWNGSSISPTPYKRISVTVQSAMGLPITLVGLMTGRQ